MSGLVKRKHVDVMGLGYTSHLKMLFLPRSSVPGPTCFQGEGPFPQVLENSRPPVSA